MTNSYVYVLRKRNKELVKVGAFSLNEAYAKLKLSRNDAKPWECWIESACLWHYDTKGNCHNGKR